MLPSNVQKIELEVLVTPAICEPASARLQLSKPV